MMNTIKNFDSGSGVLSATSMQTSLENKMLAFIADKFSLDINQLEVNLSFAEIDLDSILSVQMLNLLEAEIKVPLEPHLIKDFPTITKLAEYLAHQFNSDNPLSNLSSKSNHYQKYIINKNNQGKNCAIPKFNQEG